MDKAKSSASMKSALSIAALIMVGSNILSRVLGLVREQVLADMVGTSDEMDAYVFAFFLPEILNHFLAGSALSITFIPIFQRYLSRKDRDRAWQFFSNILTVGTLAFLLLIVLGTQYTESWLRLAGGNIERPGVFPLAVKLTRIILPAQLFFFWGALFNGAQYAHKQFLLPALTPVLYNVGIIVGGVLLYPYIKMEGFAWGVVIGAFVGCVLVQLPGLIRVGVSFRPRIDLADRDFRSYLLTTLPLILGFSMTFSNEVLFRFFGSYAPEGEGALSSLNYSYKVLLILVGVFGQGLAAGAYPFLSQLAVDKRLSDLNSLVNRLVQRLGAVVIPFSAVMFVLASNIIAVLFQRGEFSAESTNMTAGALSFYLIGAFFAAAVLVCNRPYYSMGKTVFPMIVSTSAVIVMLPLYLILGRTMGVRGIALAASISMGVQFFVIYGSWSKQQHNRGFATILVRLGLIALVSLAGAAVTWLLRDHVSQLSILPSSVLLRNLSIGLLAGAPGLAVIFVVLEVTHLASFGPMIAGLLHRKRPR